MSATIVFASNNPGKILELQTSLQQFHIKIIAQSTMGVHAIPETSVTFVENA